VPHLSLGLLDQHALSPRYTLCTVTAVLSPNTVRLELPVECGTTHNVFNVQRLKKYYGDSAFFTRPRAQRKPCVLFDDENQPVHTLDEILERRRKRRVRGAPRGGPRYEYLVRWLDHGPERDTWESNELIKDRFNRDMIARFDAKQDELDKAAAARRAQQGAPAPARPAAPDRPPKRARTAAATPAAAERPGASAPAQAVATAPAGVPAPPPGPTARQARLDKRTRR